MVSVFGYGWQLFKVTGGDHLEIKTNDSITVLLYDQNM